MACRAASDPPAFRHSVAKVCRQRCKRKRSTPESSRTLLTWVGGRAPPERKTPPLLQDLIGASQLEVLALERLQSSPVRPWSAPDVGRRHARPAVPNYAASPRC